MCVRGAYRTELPDLQSKVARLTFLLIRPSALFDAFLFTIL